MQKKLVQRAGSTIVSIIILMSCAGSGRADSARWTWGQEESGTETISSRGRLASVEEFNGRGDSLMVVGCADRLVRFVDGPQEDFWIDQPLGSGSAHIGFLRLKVDDHLTNTPYIAEPGMDGDYFVLDFASSADEVLKADKMLLCPTENAADDRCRAFSLVDFDRAMKFVCKTE